MQRCLLFTKSILLWRQAEALCTLPRIPAPAQSFAVRFFIEGETAHVVLSRDLPKTMSRTFEQRSSMLLLVKSRREPPSSGESLPLISARDSWRRASTRKQGCDQRESISNMDGFEALVIGVLKFRKWLLSYICIPCRKLPRRASCSIIEHAGRNLMGRSLTK